MQALNLKRKSVIATNFTKKPKQLNFSRTEECQNCHSEVSLKEENVHITVYDTSQSNSALYWICGNCFEENVLFLNIKKENEESRLHEPTYELRTRLWNKHWLEQEEESTETEKSLCKIADAMENIERIADAFETIAESIKNITPPTPEGPLCEYCIKKGIKEHARLLHRIGDCDLRIEDALRTEIPKGTYESTGDIKECLEEIEKDHPSDLNDLEEDGEGIKYIPDGPKNWVYFVLIRNGITRSIFCITKEKVTDGPDYYSVNEEWNSNWCDPLSGRQHSRISVLEKELSKNHQVSDTFSRLIDLGYRCIKLWNFHHGYQYADFKNHNFCVYSKICLI